MNIPVTRERQEDELTRRVADVAIRAYVAYLQRNGLEVDAAAASVAVKAHVKRAFPQALADAKEALACHMEAVAEQTFLLSFTQAGIDAAKEQEAILRQRQED